MAKESAPKPIASKTVPIEWNSNMEVKFSSESLRGGPFKECVHKGRCKRCWGMLRGRTDENLTVTGIRCLSCGMLLEGDEAAAEAERIFTEAAFNATNMWWGNQPEYGDGAFAMKVFPKIDRLSEQDLHSRVSQSKSQYGKSPRGKLTRHEFQEGSPGWFFLQAKILIGWVGEATDYDRVSIAEFPEVHMKADGSASVRLDMAGLSEDPDHREHELLKRTGALLGIGMTAAFACEIAMKCISMTCSDEAKRTHDLLDLFEDLPADSQARLLADFPSIQGVLAESRGVFGEWRYFDTAAGPEALRVMMNPQQSRSLAKAARVILDEAEYVGLGADLEVHAKRRVPKKGDERGHTETVNLKIRGRESPPED